MNPRSHLEKAIKLNPEYAEAYYNLGLLCTNEHDKKNALENFRKAVSLKSDYAEAQCELAICLMNDNDLEGSRNHRDHHA